MTRIPDHILPDITTKNISWKKDGFVLEPTVYYHEESPFLEYKLSQNDGDRDAHAIVPSLSADSIVMQGANLYALTETKYPGRSQRPITQIHKNFSSFSHSVTIFAGHEQAPSQNTIIYYNETNKTYRVESGPGASKQDYKAEELPEPARTIISHNQELISQALDFMSRLHDKVSAAVEQSALETPAVTTNDLDSRSRAYRLAHDGEPVKPRQTILETIKNISQTGAVKTPGQKPDPGAEHERLTAPAVGASK